MNNLYYNDILQLHKIYKKITFIDDNKVNRLVNNYKDILCTDMIRDIGFSNFVEFIYENIIKNTKSENLIVKFDKLKYNIKNNITNKYTNYLCLGFIYLYFRLHKKPKKQNFINLQDKIKIKIDFLYL